MTETEPTLADIKAEADATAAELAKHEAAEAHSTPVMGSIVIVRHGGKKAPGIVIDVREDGSLDVQMFKGDHMPHAAHRLQKVGPEPESGDGWYWPPRS